MPRKKVEYDDDDYYDDFDEEDYYEEEYDTYMSPNSGIFQLFTCLLAAHMYHRDQDTVGLADFVLDGAPKTKAPPPPTPPDVQDQVAPNIPYPKDNIPKKEIHKKTPVKTIKKVIKSDKILTPVPESPMTPKSTPSKPLSPKSLDLKHMTNANSTPDKVRYTTPHTPKEIPIPIPVTLEEIKHIKDNINIVTIGHVDAGKSTLMGHLLCLVDKTCNNNYKEYEKQAKSVGKGSFAYAWILDNTNEERKRGITTDVAIAHFETDKRSITILDAPGHQDYIPNMISGTSQAQAAILVISASTNEFESGMSLQGQTQEDIIVARSIGIKQLIIAVNKLDSVDFSEERYNEIVKILKEFLKQWDYKESQLTFVPVCGLSGDNIIKITNAKLKSWYRGPNLLEVINNLNIQSDRLSEPFRMSISSFVRSDLLGDCVSGNIESGSVRVGDHIEILPCVLFTVVRGIEYKGEKKDWGIYGQEVNILLDDNIDMNLIKLGYVICHIQDPIPMTTTFKAIIKTLPMMEIPIIKGRSLLLNMLSIEVPCFVNKIYNIQSNSGEIVERKVRLVSRKQNAEVRIVCQKKICVDTFDKNKKFGRFLIRDGGKTIAMGIIKELIMDNI